MKIKTRFFLLITAISLSCNSKENPCAPDALTTDDYVLPYAVAQAYRVIQGNNGSFSHTGNFRYAYDFAFRCDGRLLFARAIVRNHLCEF